MTIILRTIRSFMKRDPGLSEKQRAALQEYWPIYGLARNTEPLNFKKIFNSDAPTILEIGFGMGKTFIETAEKNPDKNYIGIEVHRPGIANTLRDVHEKNLKNIRLFEGDALEILKQQIPNESLTAVYLFFPDPWPKRRHHKRRLVQADTMNLVQSKLKPGGIFHAATDWQHYAEHMMTVLSATPGFENTSGVEKFTPRPEHRPLTKFEKRGQDLGHGVWDLVFQKK